MTRPLRIEYPGAWYHVMNRSRRGTDLHLNNDDYQMFLELLCETSTMYNFRIAAYCLMPNHYHLLVQTPDGNLARCMRHINGIYTQKYNISHNCDGSLFRGRYKSVLVDADSYLLQLVRYIHNNPLKAGLADALSQYEWCSHSAYISKAKKWDWLYIDFVLSILNKDKAKQISSYKSFMRVEESEELISFYARKNLPSILGGESFVDQLKEKFFNSKSDQEVPESKALAPGIPLINKVVASEYMIDEGSLFIARRGVENEPRNVAVYLGRHLKGLPLKELGEKYNLKRYSSVSSIIERVNRKLSSDRKFRKRVEAVKQKIIKGQT